MLTMFTILGYYSSMVMLAFSHLTQSAVGADGNVSSFAGTVESFIMITSVRVKLITVSDFYNLFFSSLTQIII